MCKHITESSGHEFEKKQGRIYERVLSEEREVLNNVFRQNKSI